MPPEDLAAEIVCEMRGDYSEESRRRAVRAFSRMLASQAPKPTDPRQIDWISEVCHAQ